MENNDIFVVVFSILAGAFAILASAFNWNFFFESRKATIFVSMFGRNGSRVFYSVLGLGLLFLAYKILSK
jgi:hypothetical protein